tara:strand:+ start:425 stop:1210 length:786 start_codon:yes stop_codon:yes gene_type:complete
MEQKMNTRRQGNTGRPFSRQSLAQWLDSPRGKQLISLEGEELGRMLPEIFGRHLLQIGSWGRDRQLLGKCETRHHAVIGSVEGYGEAARIQAECLPIAGKSVDAVVLAHCLEFSNAPHNILREANRILTDRGRIYILGFNPWGIWGARQRLGLRYRAFPVGARFYSVGRMCDWLELLDLEVTEVRRFSVGFPWNEPRSDGDAWNLASLARPFSEAYLLSAKKRVLPVNFVGRTNRAQVRSLVGVASPAARRDGPSDPASAS